MGDQIDIFGKVTVESARTMSDFFLVAPFSVIDTTTTEWRARKKKWDLMTKDTGETREGTLFKNANDHDYNYHKNKAKIEAKIGKKLTKEEYYEHHFKAGLKSVSIFDSALTELLIKWFSNKGHKVLDPFAGSVTRGFISAYLEREYSGYEIRKEQVDSNVEKVKSSEHLTDIIPNYIHKSSVHINEDFADNSVDYIMTCPPYLWLEVYSDDPQDLSTMDKEGFYEVFGDIMNKSFKALKNNRFAALVISEVRDSDGGYVSFIPRTVEIMEKAGFIYYNDIILLNSVGTLPMRAGKSMNSGRKVGRRHQNVLIFYKGKPKEIKNHFDEIIPKNTYYEGL